MKNMLRRLRNRLIRARLGPGQSQEQPRITTLSQLRPDGGWTEYPIGTYDLEDEARRCLRVIDEYTMCGYERLVTLFQQVCHLDLCGVEGALVECGTWRGGCAGMMALAHMKDGAPRRTIHLFDSFEGLPEPDPDTDGQESVLMSKQLTNRPPQALLTPIDWCVAPIEVCTELFQSRIGYPKELTHFHAGWFQNTVSEASRTIGKIALLRIDGDWYESTKVCLDSLAPLVTTGGFVILDDYGCWPGCRKATLEHLERMEPRPFLNHIDTGARYYIVP